jgi:hypothetical protein
MHNTNLYTDKKIKEQQKECDNKNCDKESQNSNKKKKKTQVAFGYPNAKILDFDSHISRFI